MWPKQSFLGSISAHLLLWTTGFCSGAINFHYQVSVLPGFQGKVMYFTPAWHLRKHCCYRPNSVCCLLSADPHGNRSSPGISQQSSPDCGERHLASGEHNGFVCQCFRATRAASFWSNDSKLGGFHHFSSQSVLQHVLPRSGHHWYNADGSGPYARAWRANATYATGEQTHLIAGHGPTAAIFLLDTLPSRCLPPARECPDQLNEKEGFQ